MSKEIRWKQRYTNFQKALFQLQDAVGKETYSALEMQGLIHAKGYPEINGPRPVLRKAFAEGYTTEDEGWLTMWADRLTTSHSYDEIAAL